MAHADVITSANQSDTHTVEHYTTTGLDSRKIAIWAFIGSECMLFTSLISTYLIYKGRSLVGPFPHEIYRDPSGKIFKPILNIPVTSASTFVLLMSSLAMVLAHNAVVNSDNPNKSKWNNSRLWLGTTALYAVTTKVSNPAATTRSTIEAASSRSPDR